MECERCDQKATFRITRARPDATTAHHPLCQIHAIEELASDPDPPQGEPARRDGEAEVYVSKVVLQNEHDQQFLFLRELGTSREIPIVTGWFEAETIERRLRGITTPRPLTHHVVAGVMAVLGGTLRNVLIHSVENHTYHAVLRINHAGALKEVDTRPSDAITMALMLEKPIRVRESVLDAMVAARRPNRDLQ